MKQKQKPNDVVLASTIFEAKAPAKVEKKEEPKSVVKPNSKSATVKKPMYHENYY